MAQSIAKTSTRSQAQRLSLRLSEIHRATPGICVEGFKVRDIAQADREAEVIYLAPPFWSGLSPFELSRIKNWADGWLDNDQPE